jgi:hypothetical protein
VVDLAIDGEQVAEPLVPDEFGTGIAQPAEQRRVDLGDGAVEQGGQVVAWAGVVEIVDVALQQCGEH